LFDYATGTTYDGSGALINNSDQYVREILDEAQALTRAIRPRWLRGFVSRGF
jgi:hypothetical protein